VTDRGDDVGGGVGLTVAVEPGKSTNFSPTESTSSPPRLISWQSKFRSMSYCMAIDQAVFLSCSICETDPSLPGVLVMIGIMVSCWKISFSLSEMALTDTTWALMGAMTNSVERLRVRVNNNDLPLIDISSSQCSTIHILVIANYWGKSTYNLEAFDIFIFIIFLHLYINENCPGVGFSNSNQKPNLE